MSMNNKPYIGVTCDHDDSFDRLQLRFTYCSSIFKAGGLPVLLPYAVGEDAVRLLLQVDGLLLTGGGDADPSLFGEFHKPELRRVNKTRDVSEIGYFKAALDRNLPVLGICRGMQIMNIAEGGTLYQDLNTQRKNEFGTRIEHVQSNPDYQPSHKVTFDQNSRIYDITVKPTLDVNSLHHQALKTVGQLFKVTGRAEDGVIEAIESTEHKFCLGVQWHPERMPDDILMRSIFKTFIETCASRQPYICVNA